MNIVKEELNQYLVLLPVGTSISFTEAERRAGLFLEGMAKVASIKHELGEVKISSLSIQTATFAEEMSKGTAKTVTENKLTAEASKSYAEAREQYESIDNDISYLRAIYEILNNGHIFYRNYAKGENA